MNQSKWQAERKKILARLSIAIYKMSDEQLATLTHLFNDLKSSDRTPLPDAISLTHGVDDASCARQLRIAQFFLLINQLDEAELIKFMNRYEQTRFALLREYPRISCNLALDIAAQGRAINCFARDISASGIYLESCETFAMGQTVSICFSLEDSRLALKLKGRVVRLDPGGVGIQYESMTGYQLEIIKDMIRRIDSGHNGGAELIGVH